MNPHTIIASSPLRRFCCLLLTAASIWLSAGCSKDTTPEPISIVLTADIRGRLVPCGCFTGQLGGMTRLYTRLKSQSFRAELRLDAGNAIQGTQDFEVMEYYPILEAFEMMNFHALNLGAMEAQLPATTIHQLLTATSAPLVSANLLDSKTGQPICAPFIETKVGKQDVIITGILHPNAIDASKLGEGLTLADPTLILREQLPALRERCDLLILLAFADENHLRSLAEQFYEADFILGGDVTQPSGNTRLINQSHVFYVANESRTVGFIECDIATSKDSRASIEITDARPELLYEEIPEAPEIIKLAETYRDAVRDADLDVDDPEAHQHEQIPGVRALSHYTGTESCIACHTDEYTVWQKSGHAHAWSTLQHVKADADPSCIGCHSVGFGTSTGYRREFEHKKLTNVGCESCHGPGSRHVEERSSGGPINFHFRPLAEGDCRSCHHGEFSRPFEWDTFWPHVKHGKEARTPQPGAPR